MTESVAESGNEPVQVRVQQAREAYSRRQEGVKGLEEGLDFEASVRRAVEVRTQPTPETLDSGPNVWCELYGFLDLGYKIHLDAYAVAIITDAATVFERVLSDAVEAFPELEAIFIPLLAAIYAEASSISTVAQICGKVVLVGVIPDPLPIPFPDN